MEMAGKLEVYLELNCSADKFFKLLSNQIHHIPKASSDKIHAIEVHEGDWETAGSLKLWTYTIDAKPEVLKEKVDIEEAKKSVTLTAVEGHVLDELKSYMVTLRASPKNNGGCLVTTYVDYEKKKPEYTRPNKYLDFVISVVKDIDAHLVKL